MPGTTEELATPRRSGGAFRLLGALRALVERALEASLVVLAVATAVFFALRLLPGDPAALVLGDHASEADRARVRASLGLDAPLGLQYLRFLRGLASLDLGPSLRRPALSALGMVGHALGPTSTLAGVAVLLAAVAGMGAALLSVGPWLGARRGWVSRATEVVAAVPLLAVAPVLTYLLAARARLVPLPGDPDSGFAGLAFASALLAVPLAAQLARVGRAALEETARLPFLTVALAKGGTPARVWLLHALPVSLGPLVVVIATQLGALLGGAVVLERLFERAGLGTLILEAYAARDLPVLEGAIVASGALFVASQMLAAAAHAAVDPRVRT